MHFDVVAGGDCGNPERPATCRRIPPLENRFPDIRFGFGYRLVFATCLVPGL